MFGRLGPTELLVIFSVALFVFGPKRIPEIARSLGKGIREFKQTANEVKASVDLDLSDNEKK